MSKYTTQLRWIVEQEQGKIPYSDKVRYTEETWKKLGLDEYEIWEPGYRSVLNAKIIDHFFFREIGFETAAQFAWYIRRTMQEIMPYYNKLYEIQAMMTEPLRDWYRHGVRDDTNVIDGITHEAEAWDGTDATSYGGKDTTTHGGTDSTSYGGTDSTTLSGTDTVTDTKTGTEETVFDGCESHNGIDTTVVDDDATSHNRNVFQDTPMSLLDNSTSPTVEGLDYATTVTYDDGSTTDDSTTTLTHGHGIDRDDTTTVTYDTTDTSETEYGKKVDIDFGKTVDVDFGETVDVEFGKTVDIEYGKNIDRDGTSRKSDVGNSQWDEYGFNSSQAKLLIEWKKAWVNIDVEIIKKLETCFMGLW